MRKKLGILVTLTLALTFTLSACSSSSSEEAGSSAESSKSESIESSSTATLSFKESCREVTRLIGRTTDLMFSISSGDNAFSALSSVALSFGELAQQTQDTSLTTGIISLQESLQKMSNEDTYFEGSTVYVTEIVPLLTECAL